MGGGQAAEAIYMLALFLAGVALGALVLVSVMSNREDRRYSMKAAATSAAAGGTRTLLSLGVRTRTDTERSP